MATSSVPLAPRIDGTVGDDVLVGQHGVRNIIYGNAGNDTILGGNEADVLVGEAGSDTLDGGEGDDSLWGGGGDDQLSGGLGNDNLYGDGGNDTLDGGAGDDTMRGGVGNDSYVVDSLGDSVIELAGEGTDTVRASVSYSLGAHLENLTLTGSAHVSAFGNELANVLIGNAGDNLIDGGAGADTMIGGAGDDTYVIDSTGDVIVELVNEGFDTVYTPFNYTAAANVENVILSGGALNATGNALDNSITGNDSNNSLAGGAGADVLVGGGGNDALNGGAGGDAIYGGVGRDGIYAGGGDDTVYGGDGDDTIFGDGGNDLILGGAGSDVLAGGMQKNGFSLGDDTFAWLRGDVVSDTGASLGFDRITDFGAGDKLDFSGLQLGAGDIASVLRLTDTASGTVVAANFGGTAGFVDVVVLDGLHGLNLNDLVDDHTLVV